MSDQTSRRALLATIGAASASLAGCLGSLSGLGGDGGSGAAPTGTAGTSTGTPGNTTSAGTATPTSPEFSRGEVLEDFENLDDWGTILGESSGDTKSVYRGSQSVLVQNKGDSAGIFRSFPDGLDLSKNDLSVAFKLEKPTVGKLVVDLYAPGEKNHAVARRFVPEELNSWIRFDVGYTNEPGEPDMSNVQELRFVVHPKDGGNVKFRLDDLRMLPKQTNKGRVMLTFDDSFQSHFDVAFQELKKRGWGGVAATIPSEVGDTNRMEVGDLRRMNDNGWDIVSHPQISDPVTPLPTMSKSKQRTEIEDTKRWLELKGFSEGAKYFVTPFDRISGQTLEIVRDVHDLGFLFGACNNATLPSGRHIISRVYGNNDGLHGAWRQLKLAQRRNQMTVLAFHDIGPEGDTSVKNFRWLLDIIEKFGLEVVTASDLAGQY